MTALFRVWRPDCGQRAATARLVEAESADAAVEHEHARDWEAGDEVVFCVQLVRQGGVPRIGTRAGKVQVVRSRREIVPVFVVSEPLAAAQLKARCPGCRRRFLDLGEWPVRSQCRGCSVRTYMRQVPA
jgi:hypothetical protein